MSLSERTHYCRNSASSAQQPCLLRGQLMWHCSLAFETRWKQSLLKRVDTGPLDLLFIRSLLAAGVVNRLGYTWFLGTWSLSRGWSRILMGHPSMLSAPDARVATVSNPTPPMIINDPRIPGTCISEKQDTRSVMNARGVKGNLIDLHFVRLPRTISIFSRKCITIVDLCPYWPASLTLCNHVF